VILIPVKNLANAKQRLAPVLDQPSRTELARTMLHDVLGAIAAWSDHPACAIVTSDSFAVEIGKQFGCEIIPDPVNPGETMAIQMATQICVERGVGFTLVIPADIPLLCAGELSEIMKNAPKEGSVLVPAADGRGTNAVLRRPADLFPLKFGNDSFKPHLEAARSTGKDCVLLELPGIALDVDNPMDLRDLVARAGNTRAQALLRRWNISAVSAETE